MCGMSSSMMKLNRFANIVPRDGKANDLQCKDTGDKCLGNSPAAL